MRTKPKLYTYCLTYWIIYDGIRELNLPFLQIGKELKGGLSRNWASQYLFSKFNPAARLLIILWFIQIFVRYCRTSRNYWLQRVKTHWPRRCSSLFWLKILLILFPEKTRHMILGWSVEPQIFWVTNLISAWKTTK